MTFWGGIDWNTLIGPDPNVDRYPPEWLTVVPEHLRGRYALPGWTGNGIEPWGLQPDPVGCDGNLFYRGWLNLLLSMRHYVSGRQSETTPFDVTGYQNRQFTWTHERIANFISAQLVARPQGAHCENTKIWPFCMSAAGLGLKLYDALLDTSLNEPFLDWVVFAEKHYMGRDRKGRIDWVAFYYDPIENATMTFPGPVNGYSALVLLHYLYPQNQQLGIDLYESAMRQLGWSNPKVPVIQLADDPQLLSTALWMAREIGDTTTWERLRRGLGEPVRAAVLRRRRQPLRVLAWRVDSVAARPDQRHDDDDRVRRTRRVVARLQRSEHDDVRRADGARCRLPADRHPAHPSRRAAPGARDRHVRRHPVATRSRRRRSPSTTFPTTRPSRCGSMAVRSALGAATSRTPSRSTSTSTAIAST